MKIFSLSLPGSGWLEVCRHGYWPDLPVGFCSCVHPGNSWPLPAASFTLGRYLIQFHQTNIINCSNTHYLFNKRYCSWKKGKRVVQCYFIFIFLLLVELLELFEDFWRQKDGWETLLHITRQILISSCPPHSTKRVIVCNGFTFSVPLMFSVILHCCKRVCTASN